MIKVARMIPCKAIEEVQSRGQGLATLKIWALP
jgi:hypothetical protein